MRSGIHLQGYTPKLGAYFIRHILLFICMLYLLTSSNSFPHQKIEKVRVINLTQGGLKAMEELAKLEEERGTPGYVQTDGRKRRIRMHQHL